MKESMAPIAASIVSILARTPDGRPPKTRTRKFIRLGFFFEYREGANAQPINGLLQQGWQQIKGKPGHQDGAKRKRIVAELRVCRVSRLSVRQGLRFPDIF
jgi:hypothetical protein